MNQTCQEIYLIITHIEISPEMAEKIMNQYSRQSFSINPVVDGQKVNELLQQLETSIKNRLEKEGKKQANPAPFGLACYAITVIIFEFYDYGLVSKGMALFLGGFLGGFGLFVSGLLEYASGDTFCTVAFTVFGLFRMALVGVILANDQTSYQSSTLDFAFYRMCLGMFSLSLFIASWHRALSVTLVFFSLTLGIFVMMISDFIGMLSHSPLKMIGATFVLLSGFGALYNMAALLIESTFKRSVLPMGSPLAKTCGKLQKKVQSAFNTVTIGA